MALSLLSLVVTQPTATTATGALRLVAGQGTGSGPLTINIPGVTAGLESMYAPAPAGAYAYEATGLAPGDYTATVYDAGTAMQAPLVVPFAVYPLPAVTAAPPAVAAAFLPMELVLEVAPAQQPDGSLVPATALSFVDVFRAGAWQQVGGMRQTADANNRVRFDASEYVQTQFAETPPLETGDPDPALSIPYRVRFGLAPGFVGAAGTEAGSVSGLAVNAAQVINPEAAPLPRPLCPPPYDTAAPGYATFYSVLSSSQGQVAVRNLGYVLESAPDWPCAVRQFVWLHPAGGWAWGFFTGKHEHGTEVSDPVAVRRAGGVRRYVNGGEVVPTLRVYSDRLTFEQLDYLRGIRDSVQVYERLASGLYVPVLVERGSFRDYQEGDKLFAVDFTARYPVVARQRQ